MNDKRYMSVEEIVSLPELSSVAISDDGKRVAFVKTIADWNDNKYKNYVWIYDESKGKPYQLSKKNETNSPKWSPNLKYLAYLQVVDGVSQIFIKNIDGYEGTQITYGEQGIHNYKWSPNGDKIYFLMNKPEDEEISNRRKVYGEFSFMDREYQLNVLCSINVSKTLTHIKNANLLPLDMKHKVSYIKEIINGDNYIRNFEVSPNEEKLLYTTTPTPLDNDMYNKDLNLLDLTTMISNKLDVDALLYNSYIFSPDGNKICYTRSIKQKSYYEYHQRDVVLEIYDLHTNKTTQPLKDFEISINPISWTEDGILIRWRNKMVYSVATLTLDGNLTYIEESDSIISEPSITCDGKHLAYLKATKNEIYELYLNGKQITNENNAYTNKLQSQKEVVNWKNKDGLDLEGLLFLPENYDENKKYPMVVVLGGPLLMPANDKWFPIEQFIEKDIIVFEPSKRGYWGYGNDFAKADERKLGIAYYEDVISGVDTLVERGIIDNDNIGIMGFSEGGYTSVFCSLYSDRFKVASSLAGSNDWRTFYISTSIPWFGKQVLGDTPWKYNNVYKETSTLTYIENAKTPTLILHKKEEPIEPLINAMELYRALKDMKVDTELVVFEGNKHYSSEPGQDRAIMKLNLKWFLHYMLDESLDGLKELK